MDSQNSDKLASPQPSTQDANKLPVNILTTPTSSSPVGFKLKPSAKGVEIAKRRLKAFAIQKKSPMTQIKKTPFVTQINANKSGISGGSKPGTSISGGNTVLIGKLNAVKVTPKVDDSTNEQKKPPKPPKPGQNKKAFQDSYIELQKRTLSEIEDMKRKMELVELGIPLGLICPTANSEKAMPTKAMPPIKSFLDPAKLDEIIREAKTAKAQGKLFKFDYQKLLPDYDNPFQRKKDEPETTQEQDKKSDKDKKRSDKPERDYRRSFYNKREDKNRWQEANVNKVRSRESNKESSTDIKRSVEKETDVNLSDYLVCDSWSLENEEKTSSPSKADNQISQTDEKTATVSKETPSDNAEKEISLDSPIKIKKLQPVMDLFKFEIDPDDEQIEEYSNSPAEYKKQKPKEEYESPFNKIFDYDQSISKDTSNDALTEDTFLESVINEIKQETMSDDECATDKGLVEYDSPVKDSLSPKDNRSVTPDLNDRMREVQSSRSDYSDGYRSTESGYKSTESGYKSSVSYKSDNSENYRMSVEKELVKMPKETVESLETWSFVLKICQPLLFRHDRNKCYRETRTVPKVWYTENPKLCPCVKDRGVVYDELETCKMILVDRVYGCDQIQESEAAKVRNWYPRTAQCLKETSTVTTVASSTEWEVDDSLTETFKTNRSTTPSKNEEIYLDREYQRFMQAVWPEVTEPKTGSSRSTTPVKQESRKKKAEDAQVHDDKKKAKKVKLSSEGWSQESDVEEDLDKNKKLSKLTKMEREKVRKRKHSSSLSDSDNNTKRKRNISKKTNIKTKLKLTKHRKLSKKYLKKLKDKQKKKRHSSEDEEMDKENRKKEKKLKKKKLQKKKKALKKKKSKAKSSSSSSSTSSTSESSTDSESDSKRKRKKNKSEVKSKKRKPSTSESTQSEELFDVNVLNNIKTERLTDDENKLEFSTRRQKPREIINVKEFQSEFVSVQIKKEVEDLQIEKQKTQEVEIRKEKEVTTESVIKSNSDTVSEKSEAVCQSASLCEADVKSDSQSEQKSSPNGYEDVSESLIRVDKVSHAEIEIFSEDVSNIIAIENIPIPVSGYIDHTQFKEPLDVATIPHDRPEVSLPEELSQCSSQESTISKDPYEKDDSHLRPSSQNSNYSFNDVITASQGYQKEDKFELESYEEGNYEMYEQLAMAYQSDVAKQGTFQSPPRLDGGASCRIETVVRARVGEIKCDWRAPPASPAPPGSSGAQRTQRPSRWGLKPGEVNIVLTGGNSEVYPIQNVVEPVYQIQSLANNRVDNTSTGSYDEAYEDMYGASDRLQYGDCFAPESNPGIEATKPTLADPRLNKILPKPTISSLDERINQVLNSAGIEDTPKLPEGADGEDLDKGKLISKSSRNVKRVSFADGYKPGQDSDVEEPPKKKKKSRRVGCAWPCPASHPAHVPLWDALPPPPPPPGSPPPYFTQQPPSLVPTQLMMQHPPPQMMQQQPPQMMSQRPPQLMSQRPPLMMPQGPPQMMPQGPPQMMPQGPPQMMPQGPPQMMPQGPSQMMPQGPPQMMPQGPPQIMMQGPPQMMQQQRPQMMQQPPQMSQQPPQLMQQPPPMMQQPPPMIQQQLMQQQMLQQQGINPAMMQAPPFAMGKNMDPNVSMPNFMPPEPPPGLISF